MVRVFLFVAFIVVPLVEIYTLIQVGQVIGAWWTVLLLVADSLLGAWLLRRELRGTWASLRGAIGSGQLPSRELADTALVVIGGTLLLTPGFVTDIVGFFFLLPLTRPLARRLLLSLVGNQVQVQAGRWVGGRFGVSGAEAFGSRTRRRGPAPHGPGAGVPPRTSSGHPIIQGEVVDDGTGPGAPPRT